MSDEQSTCERCDETEFTEDMRRCVVCGKRCADPVDDANGDYVCVDCQGRNDPHKAAEWKPGSVGPSAVVEHEPISMVLPWPPSMNTYWRRAGSIIHVSTAGKQFQADVRDAVLRTYSMNEWTLEAMDGPLEVLVQAWAPNKRQWDVDNRLKPLLDALTKAGVWLDDQQVRDLRIVDRGIVPGGEVLVTISQTSGGE